MENSVQLRLLRWTYKPIIAKLSPAQSKKISTQKYFEPKIFFDLDFFFYQTNKEIQ